MACGKRLAWFRRSLGQDSLSMWCWEILLVGKVWLERMLLVISTGLGRYRRAHTNLIPSENLIEGKSHAERTKHRQLRMERWKNKNAREAEGGQAEGEISEGKKERVFS
jgi:hypothetical protein